MEHLLYIILAFAASRVQCSPTPHPTGTSISVRHSSTNISHNRLRFDSIIYTRVRTPPHTGPQHSSSLDVQKLICSDGWIARRTNRTKAVLAFHLKAPPHLAQRLCCEALSCPPHPSPEISPRRRSPATEHFFVVVHECNFGLLA